MRPEGKRWDAVRGVFCGFMASLDIGHDRRGDALRNLALDGVEKSMYHLRQSINYTRLRAQVRDRTLPSRAIEIQAVQRSLVQMALILYQRAYRTLSPSLTQPGSTSQCANPVKVEEGPRSTVDRRQNYPFSIDPSCHSLD